MLGTSVFRPVMRVFAARSWKATPCTLVESELEKGQRSVSRGRYRTRRNVTVYTPRFEYIYQVEGRTYRSDCFQFGDTASSDRDLQEGIVARYRPGTQATCYINPEHPQEAVLDRGISPELSRLAILCGVFLAAGLGGMVFGALRAGYEASQTDSLGPDEENSTWTWPTASCS